MLITEVFDRFKAAMFEATVNDFQPAGTEYLQRFPEQFSPDLKTEVLKFDAAPQVAADTVAFDSPAPKKGRIIPGSFTVDIPKQEISRDKKETDILRYNQLAAMATRYPEGSPARAQVTNKLLDMMYEDGQFCVQGIHAKLEYLAKQISSLGKYSLTAANNDGGIKTKKAVEFGLPGSNIVSAAAPWTTPATSTPITDFENRQKAARAKGFRVMTATMDPDTFNLFVASAQVQKFAASFVSIALGVDNISTPTLDQVNRALSQKGLPTISIWDTFVTLETKDGAQTSTTGWTENAVIFSESVALGTTRYSTTADSLVSSKSTITAQNGFITAKTYVEENPLLKVTLGVAYATPVIESPDRKYILNVGA